MIEQAIALHRSGRLAEAESLSRDILAQDPEHAMALNLLGVVEVQKRNAADGLALIDRAIAREPRNADFHSNRGAALRSLGRLEDALVAYDRALEFKPDYADAFMNRGNVLRMMKRHDEALGAFDRALTLNPRHAQAHYNRGNVLRDLGRYDEALVSYGSAISNDPNFAEALCNLGFTLREMRRYEQALDAYSRALAVRPGYADAHMGYGLTLTHLGRLEDAADAYDRLLAIDPHHADALMNRGNALQDLGRPEDALACYDKALAVKPDSAEAHYNRGNTLRSLLRIGEALAEYERALAIRPEFPEARYNRGVCRLLAGMLPQGFDDYEQRWKCTALPFRRPALELPQWRGEDLNGRSILIHDEQGIGDTVQFCRYLSLLEARGAQVAFLVRPAIAALMKSLPGGIRVLTGGDECAGFDFQCAVMSLPHCFATDLSNIPATVPYLAADPERVALWRNRMTGDAFKIGVSWQGNPAGSVDKGRSFPLRALNALARMPGARLIALQKNYGLEQLQHLPEGMHVETPGEDFDPGPDAFLDTAALMASLDLIVTADTSVAHVAGALGRPVWVALRHVPDWRWLLEREDCPWYPTMRLFRQKTPGNWHTLFADMAEELRKRLA